MKRAYQKIIAISKEKNSFLFRGAWSKLTEESPKLTFVTSHHFTLSTVVYDATNAKWVSIRNFWQKKWSEESKRKQYAHTLSFIARLNCICQKWNNCHFPNVQCLNLTHFNDHENYNFIYCFGEPYLEYVFVFKFLLTIDFISILIIAIHHVRLCAGSSILYCRMAMHCKCVCYITLRWNDFGIWI